LPILDVDNAAGYLGSEPLKQRSELRVNLPDFSARARSIYGFSRRRQLRATASSALE
jgi:hypothetical protein